MAGISSRAATGGFLLPATWAVKINASQRQRTSFLRLVKSNVIVRMLVYLTAVTSFRPLKILPGRLMMTETQTQMKMISKRKSEKKSKAWNQTRKHLANSRLSSWISLVVCYYLALATGIAGWRFAVAFIRLDKSIDPMQLVHGICTDAQAHPEKKRGRYIQRMTPMTSIRKTLSVDLEAFAKEILKPHFHSGGSPKKVCNTLCGVSKQGHVG